ncbi:hypothetical protein ZIOFF_057036 [Zingiber officinale]|uniref:dUTP diphosphatase n=1 Tax=Zingiber officinale TaxID=94328 RepID=A0A8J5FHR6_ZINOF|nr:hypothetical protein ZIOFF_057036 [Zingiber officinale]
MDPYRAVIGTMEIDLTGGTQLVYIAPNMLISIEDFYNHIELAIQTHSYEEWNSAESNLLITRGLIGRLTNTSYAGFRYNIQNVADYLASTGIHAVAASPRSITDLQGMRWISQPPTGSQIRNPQEVRTSTLLDGSVALTFQGYKATKEQELRRISSFDIERITDEGEEEFAGKDDGIPLVNQVEDDEAATSKVAISEAVFPNIWENTPWEDDPEFDLEDLPTPPREEYFQENEEEEDDDKEAYFLGLENLENEYPSLSPTTVLQQPRWDDEDEVSDEYWQNVVEQVERIEEHYEAEQAMTNEVRRLSIQEETTSQEGNEPNEWLPYAGQNNEAAHMGTDSIMEQLETLDYPILRSMVEQATNENVLASSSAISRYNPPQEPLMGQDTIYMLGAENCGWRSQVFVGDKMKNCQHQWEENQVITDSKMTVCPACGPFYLNKTLKLKKTEVIPPYHKEERVIQELLDYTSYLRSIMHKVPQQEEQFLKVKCLTSTAKIPVQKTKGAAGYDLFLDEEVHILPQQQYMAKTGISLEFTYGYYARIAPRSGTALRLNYLINAGVIDSDFRGEIMTPPVIEVTNHENTERGGGLFGSTDEIEPGPSTQELTFSASKKSLINRLYNMQVILQIPGISNTKVQAILDTGATTCCICKNAMPEEALRIEGIYEEFSRGHVEGTNNQLADALSRIVRYVTNKVTLPECQLQLLKQVCESVEETQDASDNTKEILGNTIKTLFTRALLSDGGVEAAGLVLAVTGCCCVGRSGSAWLLVGAGDGACGVAVCRLAASGRAASWVFVVVCSISRPRLFDLRNWSVWLDNFVRFSAASVIVVNMDVVSLRWQSSFWAKSWSLTVSGDLVMMLSFEDVVEATDFRDLNRFQKSETSGGVGDGVAVFAL